eukprot:11140819-Heterocapsa_arctica.AAC.1
MATEPLQKVREVEANLDVDVDHEELSGDVGEPMTLMDTERGGSDDFGTSMKLKRRLRSWRDGYDRPWLKPWRRKAHLGMKAGQEPC